MITTLDLEAKDGGQANIWVDAGMCRLCVVQLSLELEKDDNINLIIRKGEYENLPFTYSDNERKQILKYCTSDTEILRKIFIKQAEDIEDKNELKNEEDFERELWQIQNRGYAMACVAQVEKNGIPLVDIENTNI